MKNLYMAEVYFERDVLTNTDSIKSYYILADSYTEAINKLSNSISDDCGVINSIHVIQNANIVP